MPYEYVKRTYSVNPVVGEHVRHTETGKRGIISRENLSMSHYVMVRFNSRNPSPCHPTALEYLGRDCVGEDGDQSGTSFSRHG